VKGPRCREAFPMSEHVQVLIMPRAIAKTTVTEFTSALSEEERKGENETK